MGARGLEGKNARVQEGEGMLPDHISVLAVKIPSRNASGGIHFTGNMAFPPFLAQ